MPLNAERPAVPSDTKEAMQQGVNVHIYPAPFRNQTRMLKIARSLTRAKLFGEIRVVGTWEEGLPIQEEIPGACQVWRVPTTVTRARTSTFAKIVRTVEWTGRVLNALRGENIACVNCHSLAVLPLAVLLKSRHRARLVYDTHELETETVGSKGLRRVFARIVERLLVRFVDEICVVSDPIAAWYRNEYGRERVWVVKNVPDREGGMPARGTALREALGIPSDAMVFIYQGIIAPGRPIRELLRAFQSARSDQHLVFMGFGPDVGLVQEWAKRVPNIHYHPAVKPHQIPQYTSAADVGFSVAENVCLSYYYSLPNKLFEYLNSGVPLLVSNFPCFVEVVQRDDCGWIASDVHESLAQLIRGLSAEEAASKRKGVERARKRYAWEYEEEVLLRMYRRVLWGEDPEGQQVSTSPHPEVLTESVDRHAHVSPSS